MSLGPQFHGTSADLHPGDRVLPRKQTGAENNWEGMRTVGGKSTGSVAFSTSDEHTAWKFADTAGYNNPGSRTSVARVHPHPDQQPGIFHESRAKDRTSIPGETIAPHFDVAERIDTRPGQQGTFPLNWNQFAKKGMSTVEDGFNHPIDDQIEGGHAGGKMYKATMAKNWGLEDLMDEPDDVPTHKQGKLF